MDVPPNYLEKDKLCSKILLFNTNSAKSIRESADIVLYSLDSEDFLNSIKPLSFGIFGYILTPSIVHRLISFGKGGLAIFLRKALLSLI